MRLVLRVAIVFRAARNQTLYNITNLDDLANITSVGDYLRIYDNDALTNLDGQPT